MSESNISVKQRLVGALVLVSLAVIFIPMVLDGDGNFDAGNREAIIPAEPDFRFNPSSDAELARIDTDQSSKQTTDENARVSIVDAITEEALSSTLGSSDRPSNKSSDKLKDSARFSNKTGDTSEDVMPAPAEPALATTLATISPAQSQNPVKKKPAARLVNPDSKPQAAIIALKNSKKQAVKAWSVQLGSFKDKPNALKLRDKLRVKGFPSYVEAVSMSKGEAYRVRVGPELLRSRAESLKKKLATVAKMDGLVVSH